MKSNEICKRAKILLFFSYKYILILSHSKPIWDCLVYKDKFLKQQSKHMYFHDCTCINSNKMDLTFLNCTSNIDFRMLSLIYLDKSIQDNIKCRIKMITVVNSENMHVMH